MIVHIDSFLATLWMHLPRWLGSIQLVRVGDNYTDFVKISWRKA